MENVIKSVLKKSAVLLLLGAVLIFSLFILQTFSPGFKYFLASLVSSGPGTISSTHRYAYAENIGWIDFGSSQGDVSVTDTALTGYAWSENTGWISLNCSNDNSCGTINYGVANSSGTLSGYAYGENIGWINFNPTNGGVTISSNGVFSGYAWGENTGWVFFNCANTDSCSIVSYQITTTWRAPKEAGGGGLPAQAYMPPSQPTGGFSMKVNNGAITTDNQYIILTFNAGSDIKGMAISEDSNFANASIEPYAANKIWKLSGGKGRKTIYAKFYTEYGQSSQAVSASIKLKLPEKTVLSEETKETSPQEQVEEPEQIEQIVEELKKLLPPESIDEPIAPPTVQPIDLKPPQGIIPDSQPSSQETGPSPIERVKQMFSQLLTSVAKLFRLIFLAGRGQ